jgi:hypothetical protein
MARKRALMSGGVRRDGARGAGLGVGRKRIGRSGVVRLLVAVPAWGPGDDDPWGPGLGAVPRVFDAIGAEVGPGLGTPACKAGDWGVRTAGAEVRTGAGLAAAAAVVGIGLGAAGAGVVFAGAALGAGFGVARAVASAVGAGEGRAVGAFRLTTCGAILGTAIGAAASWFGRTS